MAEAIYRLPRTDERYGHLCPRCAGPKAVQAGECWSCWQERRRGESDWTRRTCPDCGGPKVRKAKRCRRCRNRHDYGTIYLNGRPVELTCPDCGGPKKLKRASRCRACATRYRWRKGRASEALGR